MSTEADLYPWLTPLRTQLLGLHAKARLPHALLIQGAGGVGKHRLAEFFARDLLCHQPTSDGFCGHCKSCDLTAAGTHPDLHYLRPEESGKVIKVDQIRSLGEFVHNTAQQGGYRVVIITPADAMNVAASNALLKSLEEPGENTVMLLLTHHIAQILPTIKSRCQTFSIPLPSEQTSIAWIQSHREMDDSSAQQLLSLAYGSPVTACNYASDEVQQLRRKLVGGLADALKHRRGLLQIVADWHNQDLDLLLGWWAALLADIARIKWIGESAARFQDCYNMAVAVAARADAVALFDLSQQVSDARKEVLLRQNVNAQLMLEHLLVAWMELSRQRTPRSPAQGFSV